jgi:hypothetical protein
MKAKKNSRAYTRLLFWLVIGRSQPYLASKRFHYCRNHDKALLLLIVP